MRFELLDFNNTHYATNLQQAETVLKWDSAGSTHHLILRGDFGTPLVLTADDARRIEKHSNDQIFSGKEIHYADQRYFAVIPRAYVNNYLITASPAGYAVFCCEYDPATDICRVYLTNDACQYQCDVSANLDIGIRKEEVKRGFLSRKPEKEYYEVHIPNIPGYTDGTLRYTYDGCRYHYPVTREMLGKTLHIPSFNDKPPRIESASANGYKLTIRR